MDFNKMLEAVGIMDCPEEFKDIFDKLPADDVPVCDLALIDKLQEEYNVFGRFYGVVRDAAQKINEDAAFSAWVRVLMAYSRISREKPPVPLFDGDPKKDLVSFFAIIPEIPNGIARYKKMGFTEEEIAENMREFVSGISIVEEQVGRPAVNALYYVWLWHFARAEIFKVHSIQFEFRTMPTRAVFLRNKKTGQVIPVMVTGEFDASGKHRIGSLFYEEAGDGAFATEFSEDDENFYGHGAVACAVSAQRQTFPKSQWECIARPGDKSLGMHFPRKADISPENFTRAIEKARKIVQERCPEYIGCPIECSSWLLDPALEDILGPESKIVQMGKRFVRYPVKSGGKHVFGFVFPKNVKDYASLPENTRLERGLKQLYLGGGCNYSCSGMVIE